MNNSIEDTSRAGTQSTKIKTSDFSFNKKTEKWPNTGNFPSYCSDDFWTRFESSFDSSHLNRLNLIYEEFLSIRSMRRLNGM